MIAHKVALAAALSLCAAGAHAQERQVCYQDPLDPLKIYCPEAAQRPQLRAGRTGVPSAPTAQRPTNPGTDAVIGRVTTDPIEDEIKRRMRIPKWVPTSKPSPGQVFCLYTEPCAAFVDASWPEETSRHQTTKSGATARLERERYKIDEALKDPSPFPSFRNQCVPRGELERRRCEVEEQVQRARAADDAQFMSRHYDAHETDQMIKRIRGFLSDPSIDPRMRTSGEEALRTLERAHDSFERRGISPYPPPAPVRPPVVPPLKPQRQVAPRPAGPTVAARPCVKSSPYDSCGVQ